MWSSPWFCSCGLRLRKITIAGTTAVTITTTIIVNVNGLDFTSSFPDDDETIPPTEVDVVADVIVENKFSPFASMEVSVEVENITSV